MMADKKGVTLAPVCEQSNCKETLTQAIIELLKVRTLITLAIIGVMSYLAIIESIEPETFMAIASAVVTYYFTRREG